MFEGIVLLTEAVEQVALSQILTNHRPALTVRPAADLDELCRIDAPFLRNARLIAFASQTIVPPEMLATIGHGAYNFHPGPPNYPGWAPAHFALYDGATEFGVTLHAMAERVDSGPILDLASFAIPQDASVPGLCELTYSHLVTLFVEWAGRLSSQPALPTLRPAVPWSGQTNSRRAYRAACDIPLDISSDELRRRMRAFGGNHYGVSPTINLHGVTFTATMAAENA
jgi:methionyl-tRNA formyltransferase